MPKRLIGLETEYSIKRFSEGKEKIDNRIIYDQFVKIFNNFTKIVEGTSVIKWRQIFTENGSAFCYESLPLYLQDGLLESATPECESPLQVLLYQKSIDCLLHKSILELNGSRYFQSPISLIKNCKDAYGNIYGAQENYSVVIGSPFFIFLYRAFLMIYGPLIAVYIVHIFLLSFVLLFIHSTFLIFFYVFYIVYLIISSKSKYNTYDFFINPQHQIFLDLFEKTSGKILTYTEIFFSFPLIVPFVFVLNQVLFRDYKKKLLSFFITRILITGSGSLESDGNYYLSEKATKIKKISRTSNFPAERCFFDLGNIMKLTYLSLIYMFKFDLIYLKQLFQKEQRFQISMSDSCMSSEAELLKVGIPSLLLDMIDEQFLKEAPIFENPIDVVRIINQYPNYRDYRIKIKNHRRIQKKEMTALEVQKWYLDKAKEYLKNKKIINPEYNLIVNLWEEILNLLEINPVQLFGRVDWITKKILIHQSLVKEEPLKVSHIFLDPVFFEKELFKKHYPLLKVVDIKYHDLYDGYYLQLESNGFTKKLFTEAEIEAAITNPPVTEKGYAMQRSKIIKLNQNQDTIQLSWNFAKIGSGITSKVVHLDKFKKNKN
ncbi:MAG: proteasome accessory factor PafA2 family protein [Leptonema sp. (in: bacteria)]